MEHTEAFTPFSHINPNLLVKPELVLSVFPTDLHLFENITL
jgi:hypothetical protein